MTGMPSILVVEPSAEQSKHRAAGVMVRRDARVSADTIKKQLKE
ncbi:MAG: hypothetical protein H6Q55_3869, partial [Deltaproteobacteria bacterium]|nr:hypothetical protein [Deltaproteobacteria bacterium]